MWITLNIGFQLVSNDAHPARLSEDPIYSLFQNESDITFIFMLISPLYLGYICRIQLNRFLGT